MAVTFPIPVFDPVTTAVFPSSLFTGITLEEVLPIFWFQDYYVLISRNNCTTVSVGIVIISLLRT